MQIMKKGYMEFDLLLLLAYFSLNYQLTMARHAHHHNHHRTQKPDECYRCPPGYGVERHCNRLHDTECGACAPDHYSSHFSELRPCYPCSRCGQGLYVAHKCTASSDTVCDSCNTYRGPHNEDFYERCVRPRLDFVVADSEVHSQKGGAKEESEPHVSAEHRTGVHSSVVIVSSLVIAAVAVIFLATCFFISTRKHCKKVTSHYPYQAVATKEAVML